jgi:hypothetical protein
MDFIPAAIGCNISRLLLIVCTVLYTRAYSLAHFFLCGVAARLQIVRIQIIQTQKSAKLYAPHTTGTF